MTNQGAFAAIVPIVPAKLAHLKTYLKTLGDDVTPGTCPVDLSKFKTVHFMRWVVLNGSQDLQGRALAPSLVLSTNFDLPLDGHLQELVQKGQQEFRTIYSHCEGFDQTTDIKSYLLKYEVPYAAFYVGTRGRSVEMIHREQHLRNEIQKFLDQLANTQGKTKKQIHEAIKAHISANPELQWAQHSDSVAAWKKYFLGAKERLNALLVIAGIALLGTIAASAWVGPLWLGTSWWHLPTAMVALLATLFVIIPVSILRYIEGREEARPLTSKPVGARLTDLLDREDQVVQNQLSNVVLIKPGLFRIRILRLVLWVIDFAGRVYFTRGALGGIPTIHFARWIIFDNNRRLLFFSNFDGSWENYLGDFIDKASVGLTAVWSNTVGCPPARFLFLKGGARDEPAFKKWVRENQLLTDVWWSAYKDLSVQNINNNSYIRVRLFTHMDDEKLTEWLERF